MKKRVGRYDILDRLGSGALGDVYRARDTKVGRTVALMQPPAALVSDPARRGRFLHDARAAITLNHPNIAALYEVLEQDGRCYLAYEFAAGPSLREEMAGQRLGLRRAAALAAQLADALAEGHARGIVHGDLRPDTVVVTPKGSTKILNFGMVPWTAAGAGRSRTLLSSDAPTKEEALVVAYMSPEQASGAATDPRSDLFSLGVMLHEMLTGQQPFDAATPAATIENIIGLTPPRVSLRIADVPPRLDALVLRAMSKQPEARHRGAAEVAADLRKIVSVLDARAGERGPATVMPIQEDRGLRRRWWGAAALAGAAAGVWWLSR